MVVTILLYGCTSWTLTKHIEKKLESNWARMLWAILNKSLKQHPTKQQLYGHQPLFSKTIKITRIRHAGHCWRSNDELKRDVLLWNPSHGRAKAGRPARTYMQQLCVDTRWSPENLPEAMDDSERYRERVRDIRADSAIWWWWWWYVAYWPLAKLSIRDLWDRMFLLCKQSDYRKTSDALLEADHVNNELEERVGVMKLYIHGYPRPTIRR